MNESTGHPPVLNVPDVDPPQEAQRNEQEPPQNSDRPVTPPNHQGLLEFSGSLGHATLQLPHYSNRTLPTTTSRDGGQENEGQLAQRSKNLHGVKGKDSFPPEAEGSFQQPEASFQPAKDQTVKTGLPRNQLFFGEWSELATGIFSKGTARHVEGQAEPDRPLFPLQYPAPGLPAAQWNNQNNTQPQGGQDIEMGNNNMDYEYQNGQGNKSANYPQQAPAWGVPQNAQAYVDSNYPPPQPAYGVPQGNYGSEFGPIANQGYIQGSAHTQGSRDMNNTGILAHHAPIDLDKLVCPICNRRFVQKGVGRHVVAEHFTPDGRAWCTICLRDYTTSKNLLQHYRTQHNTGELNHKHPCPEITCGKKFRRAEEVIKHVARVHNGEKPYPCPHCDKSYMNSNGLKYHTDRTHADRNS